MIIAYLDRKMGADFPSITGNLRVKESAVLCVNRPGTCWMRNSDWIMSCSDFGGIESWKKPAKDEEQ